MNNESLLLNNKCLHVCAAQLRLFSLWAKFHYTISQVNHSEVRDIRGDTDKKKINSSGVSLDENVDKNSDIGLLNTHTVTS